MPFSYKPTELDPLGCFIDGGVRDLEGPYISTSDMTPQNCILYCNTNGYNYAGVQVRKIQCHKAGDSGIIMYLNFTTFIDLNGQESVFLVLLSHSLAFRHN